MRWDSSGLARVSVSAANLSSCSRGAFGDTPCLSLNVTPETLAPLGRAYCCRRTVRTLELHAVSPSGHLIYDRVGESNDSHTRATVPEARISFLGKHLTFWTLADT